MAGVSLLTDDNGTTQKVINEVQAAIHVASQDYFKWSNGNILYDKGVETLMQVNSAKRLFDFFNHRPCRVRVHLERAVKDFVPSLSGRIDLTLELDDALYAIEFKRYSNPAQTAPDLARLRKIMDKYGGIGLFAAPCYMKEREGENWDWPLRDKIRQSNNTSQIWHLSEPKRLADLHSAGWSHERALVIEVIPTRAEADSRRGLPESGGF